jgi:hypothetical protein
LWDHEGKVACATRTHLKGLTAAPAHRAQAEAEKSARTGAISEAGRPPFGRGGGRTDQFDEIHSTSGSGTEAKAADVTAAEQKSVYTVIV